MIGKGNRVALQTGRAEKSTRSLLGFEPATPVYMYSVVLSSHQLSYEVKLGAIAVR